MGYNTIAFIPNVYMHDMRKSPKACIWGLTNPPMTQSGRERWKQNLFAAAEEAGEPRPPGDVIKFLETFHASDQRVFFAGGNTIRELEDVEYGYNDKDEAVVTAKLPEWHDLNRKPLCSLCAKPQESLRYNSKTRVHKNREGEKCDGAGKEPIRRNQ